MKGLGTMAQYRLPRRDELSTWIRKVAAEMYPTRPKWGPLMRHYEAEKERDWNSAHVMLREYGYAQDVTGWRQLVADLTGLRVPLHGDLFALSEEEKDLRRFGPVPRVKRLPYRYYSTASCFSVIVRRKPVMVWEWRSKTYQTVGWRDAMVVR